MDGKQRDQNGSTDLTPTMQAGQDSEGGGVVKNKCVCCMQWWCCGCGTRRPSNLEAFCKRPRGGHSAFYFQVERSKCLEIKGQTREVH